MCTGANTTQLHEIIFKGKTLPIFIALLGSNSEMASCMMHIFKFITHLQVYKRAYQTTLGKI